MFLLFCGTTEELLICHMIALVLAVLLDLMVGDPHWLFHPIRLVGWLIGTLERSLLGEAPRKPRSEKSSDPRNGKSRNPRSEKSRDPRSERVRGTLLCVVVITVTLAVIGLIQTMAYGIHVICGISVEVILTCYILAARNLRDESRKVYLDLEEGSKEKARADLSMIVGRDTERLEEDGILRAAVETVSENTSDGVIAPLLYAALGGPIAAYLYKAVNTMDSMVGYRNERYEYFGKTAARLDDFVNFIPSRLSALGMIAAAYLSGIFSEKVSGTNARRIWKRDRRKHASPNSAQTESVCAGALGIRLGGPSDYGGIRKEKPYLGDPVRNIERKDILRANGLMFLTEAILLICITVIFSGICFLGFR